MHGTRTIVRLVFPVWALFLIGQLEASNSYAAIDWEIKLDPGAPTEPLSPALLGHYGVSGDLLSHDQEAELAPAMSSVGFSDWRVGTGRWESSALLLPTLTDTTLRPIVMPEAAAPAGADELTLIAARD